MGKTNQNFKMWKGDDLVQPFLHAGAFWTTQRQVLSVEASDEINFRFYSEVGTVLFTKTRAGGGITITTSGYHEADDTINVLFAAADTSARAVGDYAFQLEVVYGGTENVIVAEGIIELRERA